MCKKRILSLQDIFIGWLQFGVVLCVMAGHFTYMEQTRL